jgi:hypothetical protein
MGPSRDFGKLHVPAGVPDAFLAALYSRKTSIRVATTYFTKTFRFTYSPIEKSGKSVGAIGN